MASRLRFRRFVTTLVTALVLLAVVSPKEARADDDAPNDHASEPRLSVDGGRAHRGIGVETSALFPFFPGLLFQLRAAVPTVARGQVVLGIQTQAPTRRAEEGRFATFSGTVGYRQYAWKGLHLDALVHGGWGGLRGSVVDGRDYDSFDLEVMALVGYRVDVGPAYALLQPLGTAAVVYRSNPWPIVGEGTRVSEPPIFVANVLVGVQF
jgi:hypothetical protein